MHLSLLKGNAKRRVQVVPCIHKPFSVLVFLFGAKVMEEDVTGLVNECFTFAWPTLQKCIGLEYERLMKQKCQTLLRVARRLFTQIASLDTLLQLAMVEAKRLTRAEACSILLVDQETMQLIEHFDINEQAVNHCQKRFPIDIGITGEVIKKGVLVNAQCAPEHPAFDPTIDEHLTGVETRSMLVFPIREQTGIIGVGQLINKMEESYFDASDEEMALAFSIYCGVSIVHSVVYEKIQESHIRNAIANELIMYYMKVTDAEVDRVLMCEGRHSHPELTSLRFDARVLAPPELPCFVLAMFGKLGLITRFKIKSSKLVRFILYVQKGYRDVPYHNWFHAFSVLQFAYAALFNFKLVSLGYLNDLQVLMYVVAALVHDLDHRGTTNSFQIAGHTTLAALYSSEGSVMERHHLAQAMSILNTEGCDILQSLPRRDYDRALVMLRDYLLASDLSNYFSKLDNFRQMVKDGYHKGNRVHISMLQALLMNAADLGEQLKDWNCVKKTAAAVLTEFFHQGDEEKSRGELPAETMDREKCCIPSLQIEFIRRTTIPLFEILAKIIPKASNFLDIMEGHIVRWEASRSVFAEVPTMAGLSVLLSPELDALIDKNIQDEKDRQLRRELGIEEEEEVTA